MEPGFKIDFLGIGPAKAGTTWIGHMLEKHPEICMAEPKEVHYFNDRLSFNRLFDTTHYSLGMNWYKKHFKHCHSEKIKGEVTPMYIIDPIVPERIFKHNPDVKLIVCLRSPFERIVSHYHSIKDYHKEESRTISQAIREEPEYIEASMYYKNLLQFLPYFNIERFFFSDMEEIKSNPHGMIRKMYAFLGVDENFIPPGIKGKSNPARSTRSSEFGRWSWNIHRKMIEMGLSPFVRFLKKMGVGKWLNQINSKPLEIVTLSVEDKEYIKSKLEKDIIQLGHLLQKDFTPWLRI